MLQLSKNHNRLRLPLSVLSIIGASLSVVNYSNAQSTVQQDINNTGNTTEVIPAESFDLSHWKLTLPTDINKNGKVDDINNNDLQKFSDEHFFYIDKLGHLVFTAPNRGGTTITSANTRSELRYMSNPGDNSINARHPSNNFAVASHPNADQFATIGGKMEVTMHVDHAPRNSHQPNDKSSYASVIGQIHSTKDKSGYVDGYGYGNEALKIFYKKWPDHETGSIYWNYERNLEKGNTNRTDISYLVWGKPRKNSTDPGEQGIALGEDFSYTVNVYKDTMYLTFDSPRLGSVQHQINLADNIDANGNVDEKDNPFGYKGDGQYFKAGVYNQCRAVPKKGQTKGRCPGTGDWEIDKANGDYAQVSFSKLIVSDAVPQDVSE